MFIDDEMRPKYVATAHARFCSCRKPIDECVFWSKFIRFVQNEESGDFGKRYKHLIDLAYKEFGPQAVMTDSSKYLAPLRQLVDSLDSGKLSELSITKDDLLVLHLVKDVRSYVTSMKKRKKLSAFRIEKLTAFFYQWCHDNQKLRQYLESEDIRHMRLSYEALCFDTESVVRQVCNKAGIEFSSQMLNLNNSIAHIGLGNPMRTHKIKSKKIIYDYRWFYQMSAHILYLLLPGVKRCNEQVIRESFLFESTNSLFEPKE